MDYLIAIVKTLSGKEKSALLGRIKSQKLKHKLYALLVESDDTGTSSLSLNLSYEKNSNSLFTLKNRLLDDVLAVKQQVARNEVLQVEEQVQYLFPLLMNGENHLLLRELKKLEKSALKYELFNSLKEIYYCYFLVYHTDGKKGEWYLRQVEAMARKAEVTFEAEKLFYSKLLHLQELFYYPSKKVMAEMKVEREKLHHYNSLVQSNTSKFYLACTDAMMELNAFYTPAQNAQAYKTLQTLSRLYEHSFLKRTLPAGETFINVLYLKYYYLVNDAQHLATLQRSLFPGIFKLDSHLIFNGTYLSYVFITLMDYLKNGKTGQAIAFISKNIKEEGGSHTQLIPHRYYLLAIKEYYTGNHAQSSSLLVKARNHSKDISPAGAWIVLEALLLNLLNMMHQREFIYLEHEISLLRRYAVKYRIDEQHVKAFGNLFKAIRDFEKAQDETRVQEAIEKIQNTTLLMKLLVPTLASVDV